jgi:uncharacterized membrane protein
MMKNIVLAVMLFGMAFAGLSIDEYSLTKDIYSPGEPGFATIKVTNPVGTERVSAISMAVNAAPELSVTSTPKLADIDAGGSAIISIPFKVKSDAKPGIYTIHVFFSGFKSSEAAGNSQLSVNSVTVPVTVVNEPEFSFYVDTKLLTGFDSVNVTITNNGGNAKNVRLSLPGEVSLYGSDQMYLGDISGNKTVELLLDSRDVEDGTINVPMVLEYDDELGISHTDNASIRMTVRDEQLDISFIQKTDLFTRSENTLTIEVKNDGDTTLKDVQLSFMNNTIRLKDTNKIKFGDLAPGATSTVSAVVYTELAPGLNLLPSKVEWIEQDVQNQEERDVAITITSDADVAVYLEAKPLPLSVGTEHTVSVLVSNLGSFAIENVDVTITSPAMSSLDISNNQYIGGLQTDDFSTVQFLMKPNMTGNQPVYLKVNYRDQSGEWKSETITQYISIYEPDMQDSSPIPLLLLLVVVAVLVWWFKFRKKK